MTSPTPYLLRGLFEWICDNQMSPYLRVVVNSEEVIVPEEYIENGVIILNVSPAAVRDLHVDSEAVSFSARFNQVPFDVYVPVSSVQAIYARETGQGLVFFEDASAGDGSRASVSVARPKNSIYQTQDEAAERSRPHLRLVE